MTTQEPPQTFDPVNRPVRTRIAPSPTGFFHVGGGRTALYNLFVARQHGGKFVLRVEDTDTERHQEEAVTGIQKALEWLGVEWDEGPYRQSERFDAYREAADKLFAEGKAYWCDLTPEEIDKRAKENGKPGYDGYSRDRGLGPGPGRVLRFRVPEGSTPVHDVIRDNPVFDNSNIEDFVIMRSNGIGLWLLAVTVDDIFMNISHVIRGDEHLPNTPKQIMLWGALGGGPTPVFAHLPVLVNETRKKLSKRRDKVAMEDYRDDGILPEAMRNYLTLLGWSPGEDQEFISMEESIDQFRLENVVSNPAFFDLKKLNNMNGHYIRKLSEDEFVERSSPFLPEGEKWDEIRTMAPLVQERVTKFSEAGPMVGFFFASDDALEIDPAAWEKVAKAETTKALLTAIVAGFESATDWTAEVLHEIALKVGESHGLKLGKAQAPIRLAVTGAAVGPPLFESCHVLGKERTLTRLRNALAKL